MKKIKKYGGFLFIGIFSLIVGLGAILTNISTKEETINITDSHMAKILKDTNKYFIMHLIAV